MPAWRLPALPLSRWIVTGGVGIVVLVVAAAGAEIARHRAASLDDRLDRTALLARVLSDHAVRSVDAVSLVLVNLSHALANGGVPQAAAGGFATELGSLPQLRGLAVLGTDGIVLASTAPHEVGRHVDIARLGTLPTEGAERIGQALPIRTLQDLIRDVPPPVQPAGISSLPILRLAVLPDGQPVLLVALLHVDTLATHMRLALDDARSLAVLSTYAGDVLTSTDAALVPPGRSLAGTPLFRERLARNDHGTLVGTGLGGEAAIVAWRASRRLPLVVLVEHPRQALLDARAAHETTLAIGAGIVSLFILLASSLAARSLRAREAARAEVARSQEELSLIVGSVQELLFRTDEQGRLTFVNARWNEIGITADVIGQPLAALAAPGHDEAVLKLFDPAGGELPRTAHAELRSCDDSRRRYDLAVSPLLEGRRIRGYAGSAVDVTARWVAQQRLQSQLDFNELLLEMLPIPMAMVDAMGRCVAVNRAWEQFTGRSRAEVTGRPAGADFPGRDRAHPEAAERALLREGGSRRFETRHRGADGHGADLLVTQAAVPAEGGGHDGILIAFMDVSELRDAERATREARDAAEETSRTKSEFIANISHELRTPLQSIIGFSELGTVRATTHPRLASMFGNIHQSGQRMLALVDDLLDVSKIESTVGTFHLERADLRALLRQVLHEMEPLLASRQLRVDSDLGESPLVAKIDPLRFQQVVRNVLANAIKFSPPGAAIDLRAEPLDDGQLHVSVRDRGPGIPEGEREAIFEAFVQSSRTKDGSGGTGLGLAICRKILDAHGGTIHAENAPDGGGVFHILLPARVHDLSTVADCL